MRCLSVHCHVMVVVDGQLSFIDVDAVQMDSRDLQQLFDFNNKPQ